MTDAEWSRLHPLVRPTTRGRPPADLRRTWDAIFWIALSGRPWKDLPEHLGKPDTAHRALRRFAAEPRRLLRLLIEVADHPHDPWPAMRYRVCRAFRRVCRVVPLEITLAAERLGLRDALPCEPADLPRPHLSEKAARYVFLWPWLHRLPPLRRWYDVIHRMMRGNYRAWRTR